MTTRLKRFVVALAAALIVAAGSLIAVSAQTATPPVKYATESSDSCASCHEEYYSAWQSGAHSKSRTDHVMQEASNCEACHKGAATGDMAIPSAGTPLPTDPTAEGGMKGNACTQCHVTGFNAATGKWREDGVACEACHNPIPASHPDQDMPINKSTDLCRTCHTESRFGWDEWKVSVHFENDIVCTTCHDSHSTTFKLSDLSDKDASSLCQNCHKDVASNSQHSAHTVAGVTCIKCHLGEKSGPDVFHQVPDHSFQPKLETCGECHAKEMHNAVAETPVPAETAVVAATPTVTPAPRVENITPSLPTSDTPAPANMIGFIGMAAVFGLVAGLVFSIARKR